MQNYELVVILSPKLGEAKKTLEAKIKKLLESAKITEEKDWGTKTLATPINKVTEGDYLFYAFEAETNLPVKLDNMLRMEDKVLRHLIIKKD